MKLRKNWRRFWTLDRHHAEGFTLVELIVVIAILAILGGVAVPAYSGYVKKAERAADDQLLAAVNRAFAAACAINGEDHYNRSDVVNPTIADGQLNYVAPFGEQFASFYEGGEFKVIESLYYNRKLGVFAENSVADFTYTDASGKTYSIPMTQEQIQAIQDSTFGDMGAGKLQNQLALVTHFAANMESGAIGKIYGSDAYQTALMRYLGAKNVTELNTYLDQYDAEGKGDAVMANAAVLFAAESTKKLTNEEITAVLSSGDATNMILNNLNGNTDKNITADPEKAMAEAALAYGMYTAFVNQLPDDYYDASTNSYKADMIASANDPIQSISNLGNKDFVEYMKGEQAQKDLEAYLAALDTIDTAANAEGNSAAAKDLLEQGFNTDNDGVSDLLAGILG